MSKRKKRRPPRPDADELLAARGWRRVGERLWRHPNLFHPWETSYAYELQLDADAGRQDPVFRQLRGDELVEEAEGVA